MIPLLVAAVFDGGPYHQQRTWVLPGDVVTFDERATHGPARYRKTERVTDNGYRVYEYVEAAS